MSRLFYDVPGSPGRRIGNYGVATAECGVEVPEEVAAEFEGREHYRVEHEDAVKPRRKSKPAEPAKE